MNRLLVVTSMALVVAFGAPPVSATTIIFDASSCVGPCDVYSGGGALINQGFGDTANVNVSYRLASAAGNSLSAAHDFGVGNSLSFWLGNYSGSSIAYAENGGIKIGEVRFETLTPGTFTLNSVDIGGFPNAVRSIALRVYDLDYNSLFTTISDTLTSSLKTVALGPSNSKGLILQFGPDGFEGGIQNINYTFDAAGAVPEPASWAMMLAGFGLAGAAIRRRRVAIA